jgi:hypothetical protein
MSMDPRRWRSAGAAAAAPDLAPPSPGKVTLTQRLTRATRPPSPAPSAAPPSLQADRGAVLPLEPFALHEIAAAGVGDRAEGLPHLPALQASFGHHDLSEVRAQIGGPAAGATAALGARAYAYGDAVAFAAPPDLRLAAHEAAHVVQQRGGVRLDGGVGRVGDPYEQHADAVADRVVRGESAEDLLDTLAHRGAAGGPAVQREANAVGIGAGWREDREDRVALAARLSDALGHPVEPDGVDAAIEEFQATHGAEIDLVETHSDAMAHGFDGPVTPFPEARPVDPGRDASDEDRAAYRTELRAWSRRRTTWLRARRPTTADDGTRSERGELRPDDATHIALANAWPRRFFGALLQTAEDGYDYIKSQVVARGLPFNDQRVNIVGIRGMQGGTLHTDVGVGLAASTFDDTFFVMCLDEGGAKMIREFRGTTEPGGRSSEFRREHPDEYGPTEQNATVRDHDVETMEADQQVVYHFTTTDTSKLGRPTLTPRVETADGDPLVVAPHRTGAATSTEADATHDGDADALAVPPVDGDPRLRDRLRTRRGREVLDRSLGIAIHSGGADDTVDAESTGCQVVQGDWYGDFIATIQRGLTAARVRAGERVRPGHPATEGDVLYSLLQASDLARDEATMRAAIAGMRAPRQETGAAVDGDGGAAAG